MPVSSAQVSAYFVFTGRCPSFIPSAGAIMDRCAGFYLSRTAGINMASYRSIVIYVLATFLICSQHCLESFVSSFLSLHALYACSENKVMMIGLCIPMWWCECH